MYADTDLAIRVRGFSDGMRKVATAYPDDLDAAAFTSLALMFAEYDRTLPPDQRAVAYRDEAIAMAEGVFRLNPRHPGGTHYLIHATDDPAFAARGLDAARRYAAIAPDAEHALQLTPKRSTALLGLARASRAAGDTHAAAEAYRQLLANWHQADPEIAALAEVRAGAKTD